MKTIRRLYFYLISLISLEVVLWGLINLLRTIFSSGLTFPGADTLAQALALIFVGVPIFAFHWLWAQRTAAKDAEEQSATLRALFFYAVLLATIIPVVQNLLALINRSLIVSAGIVTYRAFIGGSQTWVDNIIAIVMNMIAAAYFYNILQINWTNLFDSDGFADVRRLYRFVWVLYSLLMTAFGIQQIVQFIFYLPSGIIGAQGRESCINGLALILVGTPIWVNTWDICQKALKDKVEQNSNLRLGVLYFLALGGIITVLAMTGLILNTLLLRLFGADLTWQEITTRIGGPLSVALPLAVIWAYYGKWLNIQIESLSDQALRAALKRFYAYILSIIGLVTTFVGLALLLSFIITDLASKALWGDALRSSLCGAIATLATGLPLWLASWRPMQVEGLSSGDQGDHARRSLVRRAYLYLTIFATVVGGMASAIYLVYTILFGVLDHRSDNFTKDVLNGLQLTGLFSAFLIYHWSTLRSDNAHAATALANRQARFAVLIFENKESGFAKPIADAIKRASPAIPVAIQQIEQGVPEETSGIRAVIIPSSLIMEPGEALRLWIKDYSGPKIIIPVMQESWYWPGGTARSNVVSTAQVIRHLAEGQEVRTAEGTPAWRVVAYVFAALFGFEILMLLVSIGASLVAGR